MLESDWRICKLICATLRGENNTLGRRSKEMPTEANTWCYAYAWKKKYMGDKNEVLSVGRGKC